MSRSPRAVLLVLAALLPASALAHSPDELRKAVLEDRDPPAAAAFLASPAEQQGLAAADPELGARVFERATELKDLSDLLRGKAEARPIRLGLSMRPSCAFCQKPAELERWAAEKLSLDAAHTKALAEAVADWDALPADQSAWLSRQGESPEAWKARDLPARLAKLRAWALQERDRLDAQMPDAGHWNAFRDSLFEVETYLYGDDVAPLRQHYEKAQTAINNLAALEGRLKTSPDPKLARALSEALAAGDVDARLAALSKAFENSGAAGGEARALAPDRPGQAWDDRRRRLVEGLLRSALPAATKGTWAGADLDAFYARHPLDIRVQPIAGGELALSARGVLAFNEQAIAQFLKSQGRDIGDLAKSPGLLDALVVQIAPIYVHESTHFMQEVWARQQGLSITSGQHLEEEAMQVHALFVLQKMKIDAAFRDALLEQAKSSVNARESLALAKRLEALGPSAFRETIAAWHYPEKLSLEGLTWSSMIKRQDLQERIEAELARRAELPPDAQKALARGPGFQANYASDAAFAAAVETAGTPHLREAVAAYRQLDGQDEQGYRLYQARLEAVNALTARRLDQLQASVARAEDAVPPPGSRR